MSTKYLNLTNSEMKKLLHMRKEHLFSYIATLLIISVVSYLLLDLIVKTHVSIYFIIFFTISYTGYNLYTHRKYLKEIFLRQKKVYRGALAFKMISQRNKKKQYIFNVDGRIFYSDKIHFDSLQVGDIVEFHVSSSTKKLFKVEKVE